MADIFTYATGRPTVELTRFDKQFPRFGSPRISIHCGNATLNLSPGEARALRSDIEQALDDLQADPPAAWLPKPPAESLTDDQAEQAHQILMDADNILSLGVTEDGRPCGIDDEGRCITVAFPVDGKPYLVVRAEDQEDAA
jgi:hypothetical protein